jgi:EAL domain-containing protein (putative c-di-GMP-specific phosphodiesterase class I)
VTTTDPRQARELTARFEPDLILLDLHMPFLDGFAVLEQIKPMISGDVPVPVVVLTADITDDARQRALALGAQDFLSKPFKLAELVMRISNQIETRFTELQLSQELVRMRAQMDATVLRGDREREEDRVVYQRIESVIEGEQIALSYQPIVEMGEARIVGFECLARFPIPPITGPDVWFADAHRVGLGIHLELAAIKRAIRDLPFFEAPIFVSLNVSESTLRSPALSSLLMGTEADRVVLELTEQVEVADYGELARAAAAHRDNGLKIAVDDRGAGYAGFRHLLTIRPDIIKLDRLLIEGIGGDAARRALLTGVLAFAREIGAHVIAQGIETAEEYATVRRLGVDFAQGFFIGRPEPLRFEQIHLDHLPV